MSDPMRATVKRAYETQDYDEMIATIETLNNLDIPFTMNFQVNESADSFPLHRWIFEIRVTGELLGPEHLMPREQTKAG